jgi:hypothetical protein
VTGQLTLGNINQTTTVASAVANSPSLIFSGAYESSVTGPTFAQDSWTVNSVIAAGLNGTSTLTLTHTGSTGVAAVSIPGQIKAQSTFVSINVAGNILWEFGTSLGGFVSGSAQVVGWSSTTGAGAPDTGISRLGAASLAIGNGTAGDFSGSLQLAELILPDGSSATPSLQFDNVSSNPIGIYCVSNTAMYLQVNGNPRGVVLASGMGVGTTVFGFSSAITSAFDTGISRLGATGIIGVGTGAAASTAGTLVATTLQLASTSGPTWTSGSAAPSSTPAYGSMYSRTAGGVGLTNLYVYTVAGWVGIV